MKNNATQKTHHIMIMNLTLILSNTNFINSFFTSLFKRTSNQQQSKTTPHTQKKNNVIKKTHHIMIMNLTLILSNTNFINSFFYFPIQNNIEPTTEQNYSTHTEEKQCHKEDTSHHDNEPHSHPVEH